MSVWICPDRRCRAVTITDDETVSITCTRSDPHLADRVFPEKVKLDVAVATVHEHVACPKCRAPVGEVCRSMNGRAGYVAGRSWQGKPVRPHRERLRADGIYER